MIPEEKRRIPLISYGFSRPCVHSYIRKENLVYCHSHNISATVVPCFGPDGEPATIEQAVNHARHHLMQACATRTPI